MTTKRKVIAVIDDHLGILSSMGRLLSTLGYHTELYASAKEFLDAALTSEAICLIVDIELGESSGIDLAKHLANEGFKIPIIFMTAYDTETVRRRAEEVGCIAFLKKPFSPNDLIEALGKLSSRPTAM
jgi:FixJ family two-component response regulator